MKRIETVKDKKLFNDIIKKGKYLKGEFYIIYYKEKIDNNLFGVAVSKKIGNAVTRNKEKRQARAIIDNHRNLFKNSYNYIIMIRKNCTEASFSKKEESLVSLLEKQR